MIFIVVVNMICYLVALFERWHSFVSNINTYCYIIVCDGVVNYHKERTLHTIESGMAISILIYIALHKHEYRIQLIIFVLYGGKKN